MLIREYNQLKKNSKTVKRFLKNLPGAFIRTNKGILYYDKETEMWHLIRWGVDGVLNNEYYDEELCDALEALYRWEIIK